MLIKWLGHASFLIDTRGKKIITDPIPDKLGYKSYKEAVDIATVSHNHWDHNATEILEGNPVVVRTIGKHVFGDIKIEGFPVFHDKVRGKQRGINILYKFSSEGIDVVHLGDLGHLLKASDVKSIGNVDVVLIPVGGNYTIDAAEAQVLAGQLSARIIIPMHFKTEYIDFLISPVEAFLARYNRVVKRPYLELNKEDLPCESMVMVLDYLS